jgi:solute carrier family 25 carnitine/acylcarnitine transporter 20/29
MLSFASSSDIDNISRAAGDFTASWTCYVTSLVFSHPLDTIRTRWQTRGQSPLVTIRQDSVRSLYCGMAGPLLANGPLVGYVFAANDWAKRRLADNAKVEVSQLPMLQVSLAGAFAGASCSILQCPLTTIRLQQQNSGRSGYRSLSAREVVQGIYRTEGPLGLYRGFSLECLASGLGRLSYFGAYEGSKRTLLKMKVRRSDRTRAPGEGRQEISAATPPPTVETLTLSERMGCALITSAVGWASIFPLDLIKNKLQADRHLGLIPEPQHHGHPARIPTREYESMSDCIQKTYRAQGWRGFWRGFPLTVLRSCVISTITLPLYDHLRPTTTETIRGTLLRVSDRPAPADGPSPAPTPSPSRTALDEEVEGAMLST